MAVLRLRTQGIITSIPFTTINSPLKLLKIDYNKFATVAGLKTAASARELMRVTKNKLKDESVLLSPIHSQLQTTAAAAAAKLTKIRNRYGALSTTMQSTNAATASPTKTPSKKVANGGTPKATPGSKKRARKAADEDVGGTEDEVERSPAPKKAKDANGSAKRANRTAAKEVKTEPGVDLDLDQENEAGAGGEGEVNFF